MVVRVKCESEWSSIVILLLRHFVVLTANQFVGRDDGLLQQQRQDSHVCRKTHTFPPTLRKNQSLHYKGDKTKLSCNTLTDAAPQFL